MINIALCDDEQFVYVIIENMINTYCDANELNIDLLYFKSAKELLEYEGSYDILLLDIDMPEMDGIEAARNLKIKEGQCKIIMLTSKRERFKDAFKIGAFRFVTKPINIIELFEALDDARSAMIGLDEIELKHAGDIYRVLEKDIIYIEASGGFVKLHTDNMAFTNFKTLKNWLLELDDGLFFECHKSYIVNLGKIQSINKDIIIMKNGVKIPVSRRRRADVLQAFMDYDLRGR